MTTLEAPTAPRKLNKTRLVVALVGVLVVVLVLVLATRPSANSEVQGSPLVGLPAPAIAGATLDGKQADLASYKGRYVVVNFFATWCGPCRQEHPQIKAFTEEHQGAAAPAVLAVAYDKNDIANARSFFAAQGGDWPVVASGGDSIAVNYGVRGLPESFVVDPSGNVSARITGAVTTTELDQLTGQAS